MPISDWLPPHRVHLLGGVSDAGKTRFVIPAMLDWEDCPPWAYIAGDRSLLDAQDTILRMGYDPSRVPLIPAFGVQHKTQVEMMKSLAAIDPRPRLVIVEGFQRLCPVRNKDRIVAEFLNRWDAYCPPSVEFPDGLTILGVCESPKQKPYERYHNPRERISGSATWGYAASTVLLIDSMPKDHEYSLPERRLWVCMKNTPRLCYHCQFDERGRLLPMSLIDPPLSA